MKQYYVYIVTNKYNTVFYIGITSNLVKRIYEHKNKLTDGFTKKYNIYKLIYYELCENPEEAIKREKSLKNLLRIKKIQLVKANNPDFKDLYEKIL